MSSYTTIITLTILMVYHVTFWLAYSWTVPELFYQLDRAALAASIIFAVTLILSPQAFPGGQHGWGMSLLAAMLAFVVHLGIPFEGLDHVATALIVWFYLWGLWISCAYNASGAIDMLRVISDFPTERGRSCFDKFAWLWLRGLSRQIDDFCQLYVIRWDSTEHELCQSVRTGIQDLEPALEELGTALADTAFIGSNNYERAKAIEIARGAYSEGRKILQEAKLRCEKRSDLSFELPKPSHTLAARWFSLCYRVNNAEEELKSFIQYASEVCKERASFIKHAAQIRAHITPVNLATSRLVKALKKYPPERVDPRLYLSFCEAVFRATACDVSQESSIRPFIFTSGHAKLTPSHTSHTSSQLCKYARSPISRHSLKSLSAGANHLRVSNEYPPAENKSLTSPVPVRVVVIDSTDDELQAASTSQQSCPHPCAPSAGHVATKHTSAVTQSDAPLSLGECQKSAHPVLASDKIAKNRAPQLIGAKKRVTLVAETRLSPVNELAKNSPARHFTRPASTSLPPQAKCLMSMQQEVQQHQLRMQYQWRQQQLRDPHRRQEELREQQSREREHELFGEQADALHQQHSASAPRQRDEHHWAAEILLREEWKRQIQFHEQPLCELESQVMKRQERKCFETKRQSWASQETERREMEHHRRKWLEMKCLRMEQERRMQQNKKHQEHELQAAERRKNTRQERESEERTRKRKRCHTIEYPNQAQVALDCRKKLPKKIARGIKKHEEKEHEEKEHGANEANGQNQGVQNDREKNHQENWRRRTERRSKECEEEERQERHLIESRNKKYGEKQRLENERQEKESKEKQCGEQGGLEKERQEKEGKLKERQKMMRLEKECRNKELNVMEARMMATWAGLKAKEERKKQELLQQQQLNGQHRDNEKSNENALQQEMARQERNKQRLQHQLQEYLNTNQLLEQQLQKHMQQWPREPQQECEIRQLHRRITRIRGAMVQVQQQLWLANQFSRKA